MRTPAMTYLALRGLGAPAVVIALAVQGVFRGFRDTKTPLYASGKMLSVCDFQAYLVDSFSIYEIEISSSLIYYVFCLQLQATLSTLFWIPF